MTCDADPPRIDALALDAFRRAVMSKEISSGRCQSFLAR
jgi:hypothetical protein